MSMVELLSSAKLDAMDSVLRAALSDEEDDEEEDNEEDEEEEEEEDLEEEEEELPDGKPEEASKPKAEASKLVKQLSLHKIQWL